LSPLHVVAVQTSRRSVRQHAPLSLSRLVSKSILSTFTGAFCVVASHAALRSSVLCDRGIYNQSVPRARRSSRPTVRPILTRPPRISRLFPIVDCIQTTHARRWTVTVEVTVTSDNGPRRRLGRDAAGVSGRTRRCSDRGTVTSDDGTRRRVFRCRHRRR